MPTPYDLLPADPVTVHLEESEPEDTPTPTDVPAPTDADAPPNLREAEELMFKILFKSWREEIGTAITSLVLVVENVKRNIGILLAAVEALSVMPERKKPGRKPGRKPGKKPGQKPGKRKTAKRK